MKLLESRELSRSRPVMMVILLPLKFTLECPFLPCAPGLGDPASPAVRTRGADARAPVPGPTPHISGTGGVPGHVSVPLCCFWAPLLPAVLVTVLTQPCSVPQSWPRWMAPLRKLLCPGCRLGSASGDQRVGGVSSKGICLLTPPPGLPAVLGVAAFLSSHGMQEH